MLSMKEKAFIAIVILFVAVLAANFIIPVRTYEVRLVTTPKGKDIYVPAGEPFNITCRGSGADDGKFSSMRWMNAEGRVIPEGIPGVRKEGKNSLKLIFTNPKFEDSGVHKCIAIYDGTYTLESEVSITFYSKKPSFESDYENITVEEGSKLEVKCLAVGDEPLSYEWYKHDEKIPEDMDLTVFVSNSENGSTLIITEVDTSHSGVYTCSASNEHGLSSKIYQLIVLPSSGNDTGNVTSLLNARVVNITSNSVEFSIDVSQTVRFIEVIYSESRNAAQFIAQWKYGEKYELKGLIPGGLYYFRFRTVPSDDDKWSRSYEVILLPDKPEVIFQNLENGNVKLEWLRKTEDNMRGTTDKFELTYFTVQMEGGSRWIPSKCAITIQIPSCTASSYTISGLSRNVYYELQLRAHTVSGYGEPYKQKFFFPR